MDLFYRVSVTSLRIPALRERKEDIPALVEHFGRDVAARHDVPVKRFANDVLIALAGYSWPGNLRELRNVVEAMVLLAEGDVVGLSALPADLAAAGDGLRPATSAGGSDAGLARVEREAISAAIRVHRGNVARAARDLRISKSTLYLKMKKYALEPIVHEVRLCAS
jgi:DNA-binding NtrC family response regulator